MQDFHWDYEVFLFIGVMLTFGVWLTARLRRWQHKSDQRTQQWVAFGSYFPLLLVIFSFRSFAYEPFRIPSSSMMPTLLTGDFIYVDKTAYGVKMPITHQTLFDTGVVERGDVVVFRAVDDPATDVIKRVVGLPGDHIRYESGTKNVYVNGEPLPVTAAQTYLGFQDDMPAGLVQKDSMTGAVKHHILHANGVHRRYQHTDLVVPEGHYFGLGDNRDFSADSRSWGLIPEDHLVGQAKGIWMHWRVDGFWAGLKRIGQQL